MKNNKLNDKYEVQPNKIFETILQGEGHMRCDITPSCFPKPYTTLTVGLRTSDR